MWVEIIISNWSIFVGSFNILIGKYMYVQENVHVYVYVVQDALK